MPDRDALLDAALDSLPLSQPPEGFSRRVMASVQAWEAARQPAANLAAARQTAAAQNLAFRLEFLDVILPLFFALLCAVVFAAGLALVMFSNPQMMRELRTWIDITLYRTSYYVDLWRLAAGAGLVTLTAGLCLFLFWWLISRSGRSAWDRI